MIRPHPPRLPSSPGIFASGACPLPISNPIFSPLLATPLPRFGGSLAYPPWRAAKSFRIRTSRQTPRFAQFWPKSSVRNFFRICTYTLRARKPFRIRTCEKTRGRGNRYHIIPCRNGGRVFSFAVSCALTTVGVRSGRDRCSDLRFLVPRSPVPPDANNLRHCVNDQQTHGRFDGMPVPRRVVRDVVHGWKK